MVLPIQHIGSQVNAALEYIEARSDGTAPILDTGFPKLNRILQGGLEWNRLLTIAALSGGGKSVTLEKLTRNLIDCNPQESFDVLSFNMEMPTKDNIVRAISSLSRINSEELYSVHESLSTQKLKQAENVAGSIKNYPIYIVDIAGTVEDIYSTIKDFVTTRHLAKNKRGILITLDHTLLTKGKSGEAEKTTIDNLMKMFVALKKELIFLGVNVIIMVLSQLNRGVEGKDRVLNPLLHYPTKNDIFAASSVYYSSDYVLITHKPCTIAGITQYYGPPVGLEWPRGLPVFNPDDPEQPMVYWHVIKQRFGKTGIIPMLDEFSTSNISEASLN